MAGSTGGVKAEGSICQLLCQLKNITLYSGWKVWNGNVAWLPTPAAALIHAPPEPGRVPCYPQSKAMNVRGVRAVRFACRGTCASATENNSVHGRTQG
eukprot:377411-Amphidinium_carterae.1